MKRLVIFMLVAWLVTPIIMQSEAQAEWAKYGGNPVITGTPPIGSPSVLEINGEYQMWYVNEWDIWHAASSDGYNWTASGSNPVFGDGRGLALGTVRYTGTSYQMWYSWGGATGQIGYASSADGTTWVDQGLLIGPSESYDAYAAEIPFVMYDDTASLYKMWYTAGASITEGRRIAYATSPNPDEGWTKHGLVFEPAPGTWYSHTIGSPFVEKSEDGYAMFFGGGAGGPASIGSVQSSDGINWDHNTAQLELTVGADGEWDDTSVSGPWIISKDDGSRLLYYAAVDGPGNTNAIGVAQSGPVPLPGAVWLLGSGLLGLAGLRKKFQG